MSDKKMSDAFKAIFGIKEPESKILDELAEKLPKPKDKSYIGTNKYRDIDGTLK